MSPDPLASRRIVFQGLSAIGVAAVLAGCGGEDSPRSTGSTRSESPTPSGSTPTEPTEKETPAGPDEDVLARTKEVPVGGGVVLVDRNVVITQPEAGRFEAFTSICTHQGNPVGVVEDNTITCQYHGSQYDAATGEVTRGPAVNGLTPVKIRVRRGAILRA